MVLTGACAATSGATLHFKEWRPTPAECDAPNWCLVGAVRDRATDDPIVGAQVVVSGTQCAALADSTGTFRRTCSGEPGDSLVVRGIGYTTMRRKVRIRPGHGYRAVIRLSRVPSRPVF